MATMMDCNATVRLGIFKYICAKVNYISKGRLVANFFYDPVGGSSMWQFSDTRNPARWVNLPIEGSLILDETVALKHLMDDLRCKTNMACTFLLERE